MFSENILPKWRQKNPFLQTDKSEENLPPADGNYKKYGNDFCQQMKNANRKPVLQKGIKYLTGK